MKELNVELKKHLKRIKLFPKGGVALGGLTGQYVSVFKGKGMEFTGYRKYDKTDDAGNIDWKASLRAGDILIRELVEERNIEVVFAFDVSSSMSFASTEKLKNEYAAELIATLSFSILQSGDAAGLVMFTDKIVKIIPPTIGNRQYFTITKSLTNPRLYDGKVDYENALGFLVRFARKNSTLIIVSDFIGLNGNWDRHLGMLAQKCDLIGIVVRDPHDNILPDVGQIAISDPFSDQEMIVDTKKVKRLFEQQAKAQLEHVRETFKKLKADLIELSTDEPFSNEITSFFKKRKEKWR